MWCLNTCETHAEYKSGEEFFSFRLKSSQLSSASFVKFTVWYCYLYWYQFAKATSASCSIEQSLSIHSPISPFFPSVPFLICKKKNWGIFFPVLCFLMKSGCASQCLLCSFVLLSFQQQGVWVSTAQQVSRLVISCEDWIHWKKHFVISW